jgi:hypothetical protein
MEGICAFADMEDFILVMRGCRKLIPLLAKLQTFLNLGTYFKIRILYHKLATTNYSLLLLKQFSEDPVMEQGPGIFFKCRIKKRNSNC